MPDRPVQERFLYELIKRLIDILGSLTGIIILSPFLIIISIIIKVNSNGSIFFAHKRLGRMGKIIKVYKFRTMFNNAVDRMQLFTAEQKAEFELNFKLKDDPRITRIGKILRKTSLDELPQLFNIFIGNMSIVGPRPIVENELIKYGINAKKLLKVKPGLTGLWQVSGRNDTTYDERVALDMEYIDKRSTLLDIRIILKTFKVVLKKAGAY